MSNIIKSYRVRGGTRSSGLSQPLKQQRVHHSRGYWEWGLPSACLSRPLPLPASDFLALKFSLWEPPLSVMSLAHGMLESDRGPGEGTALSLSSSLAWAGAAQGWFPHSPLADWETEAQNGERACVYLRRPGGGPLQSSSLHGTLTGAPATPQQLPTYSLFPASFCPAKTSSTCSFQVGKLITGILQLFCQLGQQKWVG